MKAIGVTGRMASGKTYFSFILSRLLRCKVFDADKVVHSLYRENVTLIRAINDVLGCRNAQREINRTQLLSCIIERPNLLEKIEEIVHPIVKKKMDAFIKLYRRRRMSAIILDIPLLFRIGADKLCDSIFFLQTSDGARSNRLKQRCHYSVKLDALGKIKFQQRNKHSRKVIVISSGLAKYELYKYTQFVQTKGRLPSLEQ
ncbi:dephospho-CoA kinase [Neorickettsia risticii str. Illinois]|uniref:Dephospho-CoA kinase n=1 Tax=Neorickettsia risticii (strain Illinois) TaxID=434131 RepID=C6V4H2_NEORI|nr:dephospho-CoA kinase [Neorickettsia risticii]ACT69289.1 dephospho-CoA kinase [Neorickettsia risticii str. Illinois]